MSTPLNESVVTPARTALLLSSFSVLLCGTDHTKNAMRAESPPKMCM